MAGRSTHGLPAPKDDRASEKLARSGLAGKVERGDSRIEVGIHAQQLAVLLGAEDVAVADGAVRRIVVAVVGAAVHAGAVGLITVGANRVEEVGATELFGDGEVVPGARVE